MSTRTFLIDVDTQYDFCDPKGALFVKGADRLGETFANLVSFGAGRGAFVLSSADSHAYDAWEFAGAEKTGPNGEQPNFPPHCVKGTAGWLKLPETLAPRARFVPNVVVEDQELAALAHGDVQQLVLEKEVYSLFANPNAERLLGMLTHGAPARFIVFGIALDYCVKAATLGLVEWLARTKTPGEVCLVEDATAAVDPTSTAAVLAACDAVGVRRLDAAAVLATLAAP